MKNIKIAFEDGSTAEFKIEEYTEEQETKAKEEFFKSFEVALKEFERIMEGLV